MSAKKNGTAPRPDQSQFNIRFPKNETGLDQDEEWFEFDHQGETCRLRIHDYAEMYNIPGLYEALVYGKLRCNSPNRVVGMLKSTLVDWSDSPGDLRTLDLGAGNGIVAEELYRIGARHTVGLDLLTEAKMAAERDRPGLYADYLIADLCDLPPEAGEVLTRNKLNCLITVAALGFGDIPPDAFATAYNFIAQKGWITLTIKENFLDPDADDSGFSRLVRELINEDILSIQAQRRFRHRLSIEGKPLFYLALVGRKMADIPNRLLEMDDAAAGAEADGESDAASHVLLTPE